MLIRYLPLIAGLLPFFGVTAAYALASGAGDVPSCIPYLDGCTSISATGRRIPGALPFRAALFPQAAFLLLLWWAAAQWLQSLGEPRYRRPMLAAGSLGALALIAYVTFLGTQGEFYEFMRRVGIYFYFLGTVVAQLLLTLAMPRGGYRRTLLLLAVLPWLLGIANFVQKAIVPEPNFIENRIEWWVSLLMQAWFVALFADWRRRGISAGLRFR